MKYNIFEIFDSIEGEGKRAGELTTFIRFYGCNLRCDWCDTKYSYNNATYTEMTLDDILRQVVIFNHHNVTITGGEPLIQKNIKELLYELYSKGYDINIETNGSINIKDFFILNSEQVWFTVDYKSKSSLMQEHMHENDFLSLRKCDVLKFVVGNQEELNDAYLFLKRLGYDNRYFYARSEPLIYFSPIFGKIKPVEIVEFLKSKEMNYRTRVQIQLHKIIWEPEKRGV